MVVTALIASFAFAGGTAMISAISTREIAGAGTRVTQTQSALLEISQLLASLVDAESGQRGYILTGLDRYLEPYTRASERLDDQLAQLRKRFHDSPEQLATLDRIDDLVAARDAEIERTINLRRTSEVGPALHIIDSGEGLSTMNTLRASVHELEQRELSDLAQRTAGANQRARFFQITSGALLVVAAGLALTFTWFLMRRMRELEAMITVCAWTKRVKFNGSWVSFEEYLHDRFNLQFTHGISEDAIKQLKMEEIELVEADRVKYGAKTATLRAEAEKKLKNNQGNGSSSNTPFVEPA